MMIERYTLAHVFFVVAVVVALITLVAAVIAWMTRGRPILNAAQASDAAEDVSLTEAPVA